jgi:hypothetical protein
MSCGPWPLHTFAEQTTLVCLFILLKWLFTALAILWLIQALRPYFASVSGGEQRKTQPPGPDIQKRPDDDGGEYIDYEEVK